MIYDISPPISKNLQVWPGDAQMSRELLSAPQGEDGFTLSALRATVHLGAHADAPSHISPRGRTIDQQNLERYLGLCQVLCVPAERGACILPEHLPAPVTAERLLVATSTYPNPEEFNRDFAALSLQLIDHVHEKGVQLIGIDTPSVDLFTAEDCPAHKRCLDHDVAILEGLALGGVPEGAYELIALPLRLVGFDASPVRAVLRSL